MAVGKNNNESNTVRGKNRRLRSLFPCSPENSQTLLKLRNWFGNNSKMLFVMISRWLQEFVVQGQFINALLLCHWESGTTVSGQVFCG